MDFGFWRVMGAGFWLLPDPVGPVVLAALSGFLFFAATPPVARAKGFDWWPWAVPTGCVGFALVFLLPSARARGVEDDERAARRRLADGVGVAQAVLGAVCIGRGLVRVVLGV